MEKVRQINRGCIREKGVTVVVRAEVPGTQKYGCLVSLICRFEQTIYSKSVGLASDLQCAVLLINSLRVTSTASWCRKTKRGERERVRERESVCVCV